MGGSVLPPDTPAKIGSKMTEYQRQSDALDYSLGRPAREKDNAGDGGTASGAGGGDPEEKKATPPPLLPPPVPPPDAPADAGGRHFGKPRYKGKKAKFTSMLQARGSNSTLISTAIVTFIRGMRLTNRGPTLSAGQSPRRTHRQKSGQR